MKKMILLSTVMILCYTTAGSGVTAKEQNNGKESRIGWLVELGGL